MRTMSHTPRVLCWLVTKFALLSFVYFSSTVFVCSFVCCFSQRLDFFPQRLAIFRSAWLFVRSHLLFLRQHRTDQCLYCHTLTHQISAKNLILYGLSWFVYLRRMSHTHFTTFHAIRRRWTWKLSQRLWCWLKIFSSQFYAQIKRLKRAPNRKIAIFRSF